MLDFRVNKMGDISETTEEATNKGNSFLLPIGLYFMTGTNSFFTFIEPFVISVSINPGAIALQRMFLEPNSSAIDLEKPITPAFEAA